MSATKRVFVLGRQVVPAFANQACLYQVGLRPLRIRPGGTTPFPAALAGSEFNVACFAFYSRRGGRVDTAGTFPPLIPISYSFWATRILGGVRNIFGLSVVKVPPYAEYFSISWLAPPTIMLDPDILLAPENIFSIRWDLMT